MAKVVGLPVDFSLDQFIAVTQKHGKAPRLFMDPPRTKKKVELVPGSRYMQFISAKILKRVQVKAMKTQQGRLQKYLKDKHSGASVKRARKVPPSGIIPGMIAPSQVEQTPVVTKEKPVRVKAERKKAPEDEEEVPENHGDFRVESPLEQLSDSEESAQSIRSDQKIGRPMHSPQGVSGNVLPLVLPSQQVAVVNSVVALLQAHLKASTLNRHTLTAATNTLVDLCNAPSAKIKVEGL
jgi:hypothetical protein